MIGLGIFAVIIQQFGSYAVKKREEHTEWLIARLGHQPKARGDGAPPEAEPPSANRDTPPT